MSRVGPVAALVGLVVLTSACASGPAGTRRISGPSSVDAGVLQVSAVGDSITEADSDDFDQGDIGPGSWAAYAGGSGVKVTGGWAHAGATTADMLAGVTDDVAAGAIEEPPEVLVLMGGSNDIDDGVPIQTILDNLSAIATTLGADRVTLSAVPPEAAVQSTVDALNARLPALAAQEGWQFTDPMVDVRAADGSWLPGMSSDGVHPTQRGARLIGKRLGAAVAA
jgi:lysophospholipase L1-like esterase